jgi:hypothetical protein
MYVHSCITNRSGLGVHQVSVFAVKGERGRKRPLCYRMTCKASDEYNEDNALWQQRKQLESLLKLSDTAELGECIVLVTLLRLLKSTTWSLGIKSICHLCR